MTDGENLELPMDDVPIPVDSVEPPPVPILRCPFCTGYASKRGSVRGLVLHMSSRHTGAIMDDRQRSILNGLERGPCTGCNGLRPFDSKTCHRSIIVVLHAKPASVIESMVRTIKNMYSKHLVLTQDLHLQNNFHYLTVKIGFCS